MHEVDREAVDARRRRNRRGRNAGTGGKALERAGAGPEQRVRVRRAREDERGVREREAARREARDVVPGERFEALFRRREAAVRMAGIEPVEEPLAGEEVGLGALLGEDVDLAPAVLLELVLGERGFRQDLGEEREALVEVLFENGEARDRRVAAGGDLEDRREVVDRLRERARVRAGAFRRETSRR